MKPSLSATAAHSERNKFTRMCIAEALIKELQTHNIEDITITNIVKVAGVSRMTFYKYYETKTDVLSDYLYEIVKEYTTQASKQKNIGSFNDYMHIRYSFEFFKNYSHFVSTLVKSNLYSILINAINEYMDIYVLPNTNRSRYELYYYGGALCNTYVKWIENGMQESPDEIANLVHSYL